MLIAGLLIELAIVRPAFNHVLDDPRGAVPDPRRGLVVLDNCHGTPCYITKEVAEDQKVLEIVSFLGMALMVWGGLMAKAAADEDE